MPCPRGLVMRTFRSEGDGMSDPVNHPSHYTSLGAKCARCGADIECIQVTEHLDFVIGNIVKYAWRAGLKEGAPKIEDLQKCLWYAQRAVDRERTFHAAN